MTEERELDDRWHRRFRERVRGHRTLDLTWRVAVLTIGVVVLFAGLAMLLLPGPGWAAIFIGLAILGTEFAWAHRLLAWSRRQARLAAERALDPRVRRRNQFLIGATLVTVTVLVFWFLQRYGIPDAVTDLLNR